MIFCIERKNEFIIGVDYIKNITRIFSYTPTINDISKSITKIGFSYAFTTEINFNIIPPNVEFLEIVNLHKDTKLKYIPSSIKNLILGIGCKTNLHDDSIPPHINEISLFADNPIINLLPNTISILNINYFVSPFVNSPQYPIKNLPCNLQTITLPYEVLPKNIKIPFGCNIKIMK